MLVRNVAAAVASIRIASVVVRKIAAAGVAFIRKAFLVVRNFAGVERMIFGVNPIASGFDLIVNLLIKFLEFHLPAQFRRSKNVALIWFDVFVITLTFVKLLEFHLPT